MHRVVVALLGAMTVAGCGDGSIGARPGDPPDEVSLTRVVGEPGQRNVDRIPVTAATPPQLLSVVDGVVAVGTAEGLLVGSMLEQGLLAPLPVVADEGEADETDAIHALARRTAGGVLVAAEGGLFHSAPAMLLPSPLEQTIAGATVRWLDAIGEGSAEELWLVTNDGLTFVAGGEAMAIELPGGAVAEAVVAVGPAEALVVAGGTCLRLDLAHLSATPLVGELGAVSAADRADDGTAHIATESGLLSVAKDGAATLRTFAAEGEPARPALGVSAAFGSLVVAIDDGLVVVEEGEASRIGEITGTPGGAAVDAMGDAWALDGGDLYRYATGKPVSFAADVRPFFASHCVACHATGVDGAPKMDLEDYSVAEEKAPLILSRLRAIGVAPMPPTNTEILTAADYAVVMRWVASGAKP